MTKPINLLDYSAYGGCSAKLDPTRLAQLLSKLHKPSHPQLIVGANTHDDAGVFQISSEKALIFTTDFFPPVVSDPKTFGRIAATNALSDVFAMGGKVLMALNLVHYPAEDAPLEGLYQILEGAQEKVEECGGITVGGHTIQDKTPQFGLAVVGEVAPKQLLTNQGAQLGDLLVLTKPLGVGAILAGHRLGMTSEQSYNSAVENMCRLNMYAAQHAQKHGVTAATDITGFGLLGHAWHIAQESNVRLQIHANRLPLLPNFSSLIEQGCIPGATFRNLKYVGSSFKNYASDDFSYIVADPQTSGGLLMCVPPQKALHLINDIHATGDTQACIIGEVIAENTAGIELCMADS